MLSEKTRQLNFMAYFKWLRRERTTIFFVILLTMMLILSFPMMTMLKEHKSNDVDYERIEEKGIETVGQVIQIEANRNISVNNVHPYLVYYTYFNETGEKNGIMQTMDITTIKSWQLGKKVRVKYLADNSMILDVSYFKFPYWIYNIFWFFPCLILIITLVYLLFKINTFRKFYIYGKETKGELQGMEPCSRTFILAKVVKARLFYTYNDSNENRYSGTAVTSDKLLIKDANKGSLLDILYLPNQPQKSIIFDNYLIKGIYSHST